MKLLTLEGTFRDGKIEIPDVPAGLERSKVLVTFLDPVASSVAPRMMTPGMFAGPNMSTEDDFRAAELRVKPEATHGG